MTCALCGGGRETNRDAGIALPGLVERMNVRSARDTERLWLSLCPFVGTAPLIVREHEQRPDGTWPDASNNAFAFYVIER